jgi:AcrR family transcriptional regulator
LSSTGAEIGPDRRTVRHLAKREMIVTAAWDIAHEQGLADLSLRDLARRVDLRQPSLYSYFASKMDLYDAMFATGNDQLVTRMTALRWPRDPVAAIKAFSRELCDFCIEDPVRYQLLFQRNIPGFEPSPGSYARAVDFYELASSLLIAAGLDQPEHMDLFTAFNAGLIEQQLANEPGGRRWIRHLDTVIDMLVREASTVAAATSKQRRPGATNRR